MKYNRWHWLAELINRNQLYSGAEIGVASGITTFYLMKHCPLLKQLYAVDIFAPIPDSCWENVDTKKEFLKGMIPWMDRITLLEGLSVEKANDVLDGSLEFVFIDADHSYESVKKDIITWAPKLTKYGIICGHDLHLGGVLPALEELIPNWKKAGVDNVWWAHRKEVVRL